MTIVSGARLSSIGGLHLGHYVGCFQSLKNFDTKTIDYYFVIYSNTENLDDKSLKDMILDLYALKEMYAISNFHVLIDRLFLKPFQDLLNCLAENTTLNQALKCYPTPKNSKQDDISMYDFMFPFRQAACYYLLDSDFTLMNNDNIRSVTFARDLGRKLNQNQENSYTLKIPSLIHGNVPRLLGPDYRKMSVGNQNALFLRASDIKVKKFVYSLLDMRSLFSYSESELKKFKEGTPYLYPNFFLGYHYLDAFSPDGRNVFKDCTPDHRKGMNDEIYKAIHKILNDFNVYRNGLDYSDICSKVIESHETAIAKGSIVVNHT